jgi:NitT/TauT family transport system permease protein
MLMQSMNFTMDVAGPFSVLVLLAALGLALNRTIVWVRWRVIFWERTDEAASAKATAAEAV